MPQTDGNLGVDLSRAEHEDTAGELLSLTPVKDKALSLLL